MKKTLCLILAMCLFVGTPISAQKSKTKKARQEQSVKKKTPKGNLGLQKDVLQELINNMVLVEGGTFMMGAQRTTPPSYNWQGIQTLESYNYDSGADPQESPVHKVTLNDFYIGKYEVTQQLWKYVMTFSGTTVSGDVLHAIPDPWLEENPSPKYGVGDNYPAYFVNWEDIVNIFLPRLNSMTGKTFRLPTEAEWEYAARGGNKSKGYKYSGSNNIGDVAWCDINSSKTHEVGTKAPNELGIYDMSGNVSEWCSDWHDSYSSSSQTNPTGPSSGSYHVCRGGSWSYNAYSCRVSNRSFSGFRINVLGFRLVCSTEKREHYSQQKQVLENLVNDMVKVEGGTFLMGGTSEQGNDADYYEKPAHQVTLSDYYIGKCEVTQEQWEAVMGSNPSYFKGANKPVERVSWNDCQEFIEKLNKLTGLKFRLPTEAEWEYAARGGKKSKGYKYSGSNTIDDVAWYKANAYDVDPTTSNIVGTKAPNELGLYDMSGNALEWCSDRYGWNYYSSSPSTNPTGPTSGPDRVFRGGSWGNEAFYHRVSFRNGNPPDYCGNLLGLRLVCSTEGIEHRRDNKDVKSGSSQGLKPDEIFTAVDQKPAFPGGEAELMKWLSSNIQYPVMAQEEGAQGRVVVQLVVEKDGSIGQVKVVRGRHPELDKEAIRLAKTLPKFIPGKNFGQAVRCWYTFPVNFKL